MKMKNHWLKGMTAIMMVIAGMITTSCDTESDLEVTNPNQAELDANWLSKFGEIDTDQDWSLATRAKASISVYGIDALSDYQLQLFTENPIHSENALLIAAKNVTTDANGNASAAFDAIDVLKGHTKFYASYMDSHYRCNVKPVTLVDGVINAQFGLPGTRAGMTDSNNLKAEDYDVPNPESVVMAKYDQAVDIKSIDLNNNPEYVYWPTYGPNPDFKSVMKIISGDVWSGTISCLGTEQGNGTPRTLYVEGTWEIPQYQAQQLGGGGLIVVKNGGIVKIPVGASLNSSNGGRIVVLDGGKIEGQGTINFHNGSGAKENYDYIAAGATVDIGTLNNNGGYIYNYGTLKVGELLGGTTNSIYVNRNYMYVDHSGQNSSNTRIYTCCHFEVKNDLACRNLYMFNPSYVNIGGNLRMSESGDGTNDPSEVVLAPNAQLKAAGAIGLNNTDVIGPTEGGAICEFGRVYDNSEFYTGNGKIINNLYVSVDEQTGLYNNLEGMLNVNNSGNGNSVIVEKGQANIVIPASTCNGGAEIPAYTPGQGSANTSNSQRFIIACEDLGSTMDVDFNDVVFSVGHVAGKKEITIVPLAAGGTLAAEIWYKEQKVGEIHEMLGAENTETVINVTNNITNGGITKTISISDENWSFADSWQDFSIKVTGNNEGSVFVKAPTVGTAPFMIVAPASWKWPREYVNIEDAYPDFKGWSQDAGTNLNWADNPTAGQVINR